MASVVWALLLFLAQLETLPSTSTAHVDAGNLTRISVPFLCRPDQAEALLQLKKSFFHTSTTRLLSWRDGTDCCLWEGVGCDTSSGNVTVLDLNNRGLSSYALDPAIFNLTSLRHLDLSMNCFGRFRATQYWPNIPSTGFEKLALLTHLNLSRSGFRGQVLSLADCSLSGPIHKSLSGLHSLTVINLQFNFINGPFPEFFMNFLNLTVLQISNNILEGWFPSRPFRSKNLRVLDLSGNYDLSGHVPNFTNASSLETLGLYGIKFFSAKPVSSSNFKLLKELSLDVNSVSMDFLSSLGRIGSLWQLYLGLGSVELGSISTWIRDQNNLTSLTLEGSNSTMAIAASTVSSLKTLKRLTMYFCDIPVSTMSAIGNLMDLQTLELNRCTTYGPMPSSFGNLKKLINLRMDTLRFSEPMPAAIGNLTNLKTMEIYCDEWIPGGYISSSVPSTIGQLNKLRLLVLKGCNFSGIIPNSIANLTQLTKLDLSNNAFNGEIPSSIFSIPVLHVLDLSLNQLSGPIQEFNQALSQLESVDLSYNEFSSPIPKTFFQLTSLMELDLRFNNLTGLVDLASLWRLKNIDVLHLSNNKLSVMDSEGNSSLPSDWSGPLELGLASCNVTEFPRSLMRSKYISHLDLSCNKINGEVPNWLWETCNSLIYLNLSHNMLTGTQLTSHVLPLTSLETLDLSFNRFQGCIPMPNSSAEILDYSNNKFSSVLSNWTSYLSGTGYLSMSNNTLNGYVPFSICSASVLRTLVLSHNNFSGPIPSCLVENGQLAVLNLRENQFEGMLPSNIRNGCFLHTIDLHGNKIYGQVPRGLSKCLQLEVLDFGSNQIVDIFPSWLSGLPRLSVIVLRSNKFYGPIGDTVGEIKYEHFFPSLQIIDLASNNFSGNLRPQWIKRFKSMMAKLNSTGQTIFSLNGTSRSYQDYTDIIYKGSDRTFERILTALTAIDFSNNRLEGAIPDSIGRLVSLQLLNLSHNAFMGKIPAPLGGMTDLESLDLSSNQLSGEVPEELTNLTFLEILNLSNNQLVGKIPQWHQFSTFDSSSFEGNVGLCGPPLSDLPCGASSYTPGVKNEHKSSRHVDVVLFLCVGLGFGVGFAAAIVVKWGQIGK